MARRTPKRNAKGQFVKKGRKPAKRRRKRSRRNAPAKRRRRRAPAKRRAAAPARRRRRSPRDPRTGRYLRRGRRSVLDSYGGTNPAEFFAVATESFFEKPHQMRKRHPELYEELRDFYKQDPAEEHERGLSGEDC